MPSTTTLVIIEEVARRLQALRQGTLTASSATALTVNNNPLFRSNRSNADQAAGYANAEFMSTSGTAPVPNPNGVSAHVWSTGVLTPAIDFTTTPGSTSTFDLFLRGITRTMLVDALNKALRDMRYTDRIPLSYVDDADMEASGVTSWTDSGAASTKVAGRNGRQALRVTNAGALDYTRTASLDVDPTYANQWLVAVYVRATTGTGRLTAYDATNSAAIDTEDWSNRGWGYIWMVVNLPATCELLQVRLVGVGASDVVDWDDLTVLPIGATEIYLPHYVEEPGQFRRTWRRQLNNTAETPGFHPYFHAEPVPNQSSQAASADFAPSPYKLSILPSVSSPIYIDVDRPFPSVSANTDATFALRRWVEQVTLVNLLTDLASRPGQEVTTWRARLAEEQRAMLRMKIARQGPIRIGYGWNSPPLTPLHPGGY